MRFHLLPGQRYDTIGVAQLIDGIDFDTILADKAFDANWIIEEMNKRGTKIVISQRPKRKHPIQIDREVYKWRHLIENFFCKLKEFKAIATRSDNRLYNQPCLEMPAFEIILRLALQLFGYGIQNHRFAPQLSERQILCGWST
ncbi:conserved hypothetical protein (plasmid) [Rhizobium johnstonii 3841]|uniref:Transposase DDE domain protein n=1 Tax=Rhizobium johnstonii (strain DSM 114642 / LMG 32736 / 3841) TaxID=216596 RepID=Q1M9S3_RHIJ3|nr:conserved hypothetical protein [Rhizobium johnstonii 3841]